MSVMGRPKLDESRKKQIRYGKIEDTFKRIILEIENEKDKEKIENGLRELRQMKKTVRKKKIIK